MATARGRDRRACYLPGIVDGITEVPVSSASQCAEVQHMAIAVEKSILAIAGAGYLPGIVDSRAATNVTAAFQRAEIYHLAVPEHKGMIASFGQGAASRHLPGIVDTVSGTAAACQACQRTQIHHLATT